MDTGAIRIANIPVRTLPPVLAGIRAGKCGYPTFPCSMIASTVVVRDSLSPASCWRGDTCLPLRGQHTFAASAASCFPFNCAHGHERGHQNPAIIRAVGVDCNGWLGASISEIDDDRRTVGDFMGGTGGQQGRFLQWQPGLQCRQQADGARMADDDGRFVLFAQQIA